MIECPNGEIRDRLPDLVHGQLSADVHAEVAGHVSGCAACAAEVELLRRLRDRLHVARPVNVGRIAAALPARAIRGPQAAHAGQRGWRRVDWRAAAAFLVMVGGGSALLYRAANERTLPATGAALDQRQLASIDVSIDADLAEATATELDALVRDLDAFDGLPAGEPESLLPAAPYTEFDE